MKRLFSRKSGFSLVEIVVAFAIFAIFSSIIAQVINLTVNERKSSQKFQEYLEEQEAAINTTKHENAYDESKKAGELNLKGDFEDVFKDKKLEYNMVNADGAVGDPSGLNRFVGNVDYSTDLAELLGDPSSGEEDDGKEKPNSKKYDARITGTVGITSLKVNVSPLGSDQKTYKITVSNINSSNVSSDYKRNSQITMVFGEPQANGKLGEIESVIPDNSGDYIKKCGVSGVNIHGSDSAGLSSSYSFTVKFKNPINITNASFGENNSGGSYSTNASRPGYIGVYDKYPDDEKK